jgi:hypothetical protein
MTRLRFYVMTMVVFFLLYVVGVIDLKPKADPDFWTCIGIGLAFAALVLLGQVVIAVVGSLCFGRSLGAILAVFVSPGLAIWVCSQFTVLAAPSFGQAALIGVLFVVVDLVLEAMVNSIFGN